MADHSLIEWTDATWNPITGCSVVSPGCTHCYAMRLAGTRLKHHPSRAGLTVDTKAGPVWNGEVRFNEQWLDQPLRWAKPRMIFVCAHGDLFHEDVPDEWIDRVFAVMALAPQHTFQVLTKRSTRMRDYLTGEHPLHRLHHAAAGDVGGTLARQFRPWGNVYSLYLDVAWPLPNVWLGVSAEDQTRANVRVPHLLETPAAIRFLSAEPLLGPLDLTAIDTGSGWVDALQSYIRYPTTLPGHFRNEPIDWPRLDQVIVGGENGPRPMHPDWARALRDQCAAAGTAFFFKQWGTTLPAGQIMANGRPWAGNCALRATKALAGRFLDGVEHNGMPEVRR